MSEKENLLIQDLIQTIIQTSVCKKIDTEPINHLFEILEQNKTIPIEYYDKNLTEIKKNVKCTLCERNALYNDDKNNYCWIHAQRR